MAGLPDEERLAQQPAALSVDHHAQPDEEGEWEYEYSNTETETYYLTLDLSYPEFKDRQTKAVHHSRGGYYKNWLDQHSVGWRNAGEQDDDNDENENDDDEPLPAAEADDDDGPEVRSELRGSKVDPKGKGKETDQVEDTAEGGEAEDDGDEDEEIQILELHSKNPIISYRGRVFEGHWAEVIGTEAIFTTHDTENPLPALRQLAGDVDLLGASATRIMTTEKILEPKELQEDPLAAIREEWNIRIPVGKDKTGEKGQQTRFLENLMALKRRKGELDQVTVYAKDGEGKDFKDNRDPDYKPRRPKRMFDENGNEVFPKRLQTRRARRPMGRPRIRGGRRGGTAVGEREGQTVGGGQRVLVDSSLLSTPTPARWKDVQDDNDEHVDEQGEEDVEDEDEEEEDANDGSEESDENNNENDDDVEDVTMVD